MTADNNLIAGMMEIKNSVKEVDTKWSSKTQEMEYKMTEGADALLDLFDEYNIDEVITLDRPNV